MKIKFLRALKEQQRKVLKSIRDFRERLRKWSSVSASSDSSMPRPVLAAVALVMSLMIWLFVAWDGNTETTRSIEVPIQYNNLSQGFAVGESDKAVQVRVLGRAATISRVDISELKAEVDLQSLQAGRYKPPINMESPAYLRLMNWSPSTANVEIIRHIERTLHVGWRLDGKLSRGKIIEKVDISPDEVTLTGPEAEVLAVQLLEAVIPAAGLTDGAVLTLPVRAADGSKISPKTKLQTAKVSVKVTLEDEIAGEQIPLKVSTVGEVAEGLEIEAIRLTPESVTIRGSGSAVRAVSSLDLSPIDITGLDKTLQLTLPLQPSTPLGGVEIIGPERVRVEIAVRRKPAAKNYSAVPISVVGAAGGAEWSVTPATASLTVDGNQLMLEALFNNEPPCELYIDVSNIIAKQISLPVLVRRLQKGFEVMQIEPEQVLVTIADTVDQDS